MMRCAVLTISDSCHQGLREDASGPAVRARLEAKGFRVTVTVVLPDEKALIAGRLLELCGSGEVDAVFTTGGTGVALRDVTPEATREVVEREIPGLAEKMRADGMKITPLAALSRGVAGVRGKVLLVNLPGSPKGAAESLDAILDLVPHIIQLLNGNTGHS
ncbi:MAG: MogA/MoaB family molybdenum cofactor biosynthesis protein [Acidobacteriia bacterium]|nr:MogA/MoaB family molybdenum cofactor biosynthesis protein [Terriglobia bacterium]